MRLDCDGVAVEPGVQRVDDDPALAPLRQRGEAAQVGHQNRRLDLVERSALDLALEDALAGVMADIGVEKVDRHAAERDAAPHRD